MAATSSELDQSHLQAQHEGQDLSLVLPHYFPLLPTALPVH
jgi:hypothetical protein